VAELPDSLSNAVQISAKSGAGIENLKKEILRMAGVAEINTETTVAFTPRQQNLLRQLTAVKSSRRAASIISELLNGQM
jgi:tRNA U34 5-carboxymethylaminomethyl modifying GTPase MnmE/TrmE